MKLFYGGSSSLRAIEKDGRLILRTRVLQNILLFLLILLSILAILLVLRAVSGSGELLGINLYFWAGALALSMLVMLTYMKVFNFDLRAKRLTMYTKVLGIGKKSVIGFDAIQSILIKKVSRPVAGSQYAFPVEMAELHVHLKSGETVYVDRSTDHPAMLELARQVSTLADIPFEGT